MDAHTYWTAMAHEVSLAQTVSRQEDEMDEDSKHKFGVCDECGYGLDDESDFVLHSSREGDTILICVECWIHPCPWSSKE